MSNSLGAVSTCQEGEEKYVYFNLMPRQRRKSRYLQYEWRDPADNELFSCVAPSLERCRAKRDEWLNGKNQRAHF